MATTTLIPVSEYLNTSYRPDRDYIDGELKERSLGEKQHAAVQAYFAGVVFSKRKVWGVRALSEQRVQTSEVRYRIADVCIVRLTDPPDPIVRIAPLVCIEILSRGDTLSEMAERVDDYLGMGVEHVWIIDPIRRSAWLGTKEGFIKPSDGALSVPGTPIRIPIADIYAELDDLAAGR